MAMAMENVALPAARPSPPSSHKKKGRTPLSGIHISKVRNHVLERYQQHSGGERVMKQVLNSYRSELRPLLDAIRFVESSNRDDCPDGDGGASIGPLQISEHYHVDAWCNKRRSSWHRCRNLEHAEHTVVAYWMRYCSDALSKQDWEVLAKTHNGGPRGPQIAKTAGYWRKVTDYLEKHRASQEDRDTEVVASKAVTETVSAESSKTNNAYVKSHSDDVRRSRRKKHGYWTKLLGPAQHVQEETNSKMSNCSAVTQYKATNAGLKMSASERQKPIVNRHRRPRRALSDITSSFNILDHDHTTSDPTVKGRSGLGNLNIHHLGADWESGRESARDLTAADKTVEGIEADDDRAEVVQIDSPIQGIVLEANRDRGKFRRNSQEYWRSPESFGPEGSLEMLYSTDVSAQKEEEILAELANLLPPKLCDLNESFEFPRANSDVELPTPTLKRRPDIEEDAIEEASVGSSPEFVAAEPELAAEQTSVSSSASVETSISSPARAFAAEPELQGEASVSPANNESSARPPSTAAVSSPTSLADFLLEAPEPSTSVEYVKALFSCEDALLEKLCEAAGPSEVEQVSSSSPESTRIATPSFSACSCCGKNGHRVTSLRRLCALWEEHNVDLLTRSLRFKMFTSPSEATRAQTPCLAWEIQVLQNTKRSPESQKMAKEILEQQREMIYVNIGSFMTKQERKHLYSRWGIRKLTTGRLKKLVYELLWRDPNRFLESAEVVSQYL